MPKAKTATGKRGKGRPSRFGEAIARGEPVWANFWQKVEKTETCWNWTGSKNRGGYGFALIVGGKGKRVLAHRATYEAIHGPVPEGYDLDHLCRNRACCNPAHLEAVTRQVNLLRGDTIPARNAAKTHCQNGHELAGDNLQPHFLRVGKRICRECWNAKAREKYRAKIARKEVSSGA